MDNQHRTIDGYRELDVDEVDAMNQLEAHEARILGKLAELDAEPNDGRWIAIARTHIQQGFMAAVRAVARPGE